MAAKPAGFAAGEAAVSKFGNGSNVGLPFAMFSHQYESKAIKLYYSMSTISYTPRFSYLFKMTLIECRQNTERQDRSLGEATRAAMTACSSQITPRTAETCREVPNTLCFTCPRYPILLGFHMR